MFFAQQTAGFDWLEPIIQFGVGGGVLIWFMFKSEPRLRAIESAIDRMSRSILLLIVSLPHQNDNAKEQAHVILKEIDDATRLRENKGS